MSVIEKLNISIPDSLDRQELIEGIIKFVERRGCDTEINPHNKPNKPEVLNEEEKVRQVLGIQPND
jgi:hypothetical protein|tara:strand:- start:8144 stop:8341 length:198 start_codon:yes stop_codon:yes gene_type:complete